MATFFMNPFFHHNYVELPIGIYCFFETLHHQLHIITDSTYCKLCSASHNLHSQRLWVKLESLFMKASPL